VSRKSSTPSFAEPLAALCAGAFPSLLNAVANLTCSVLDCSLYPLLLTEYIHEALASSSSSKQPTHPPGAGDEAPPAIDLSSPPLALLRLLLVAFATGVNVLGVNVVGSAAGVLMLIVSLPFVWLVAAAARQPHFDPSVWVDTDPGALPADRAGCFGFVCLVLWNTCGYDSAGMMAAEVQAPRSAYNRALWGTLGLTTALYLLPLAAVLAVAGPWEGWVGGQYAPLAAQLGGPALEMALTAASVVSMVGVLCTILCTSSRAIAAMATLRMLPPVLSRLHPRHGTPAAAVCLNGALVALATSCLRFEAALQLSMIFYAVNVLMQCAAVLRCGGPLSCEPGLPCRLPATSHTHLPTSSTPYPAFLALPASPYAALSTTVIFELSHPLYPTLYPRRLRSLHPRLPRPATLAPRWYLALPAGISLSVFLLAPARLLAAAGAVLGATAGLYSLLTAGRVAVTARGLTSAAEAQGLDPRPSSDEEVLDPEARPLPSRTVRSSWLPSGLLPSGLARGYAPVPRGSSHRCAAAEMVSAFEIGEAEPGWARGGGGASAGGSTGRGGAAGAPRLRPTVLTPRCNLPPLSAPWAEDASGGREEEPARAAHTAAGEGGAASAGFETMPPGVI
jgi:hypothetical protein